jgi:hypothetical protein
MSNRGYSAFPPAAHPVEGPQRLTEWRVQLGRDRVQDGKMTAPARGA